MVLCLLRRRCRRQEKQEERADVRGSGGAVLEAAEGAAGGTEEAAEQGGERGRGLGGSGGARGGHRAQRCSPRGRPGRCRWSATRRSRRRQKRSARVTAGGDAEEGPDDFLEYEDVHPEAPAAVVEGDGAPCDLDVLGYEELVRRNVELFIANSQRYVQETELSQHIRQWEEKMGPMLQEQEERAAFDIHSYGDRLAARFGRLGEWRSFGSLVAGMPAFEVCRYMLASLQLANDYTVEVAQDPGLEEAVDTMRLRLLRREQAHERFRTYRASLLCD
ncbi:condensin-2 complex subunit H2 isoform X2 [Oxyura jamaicensis]|uniref:condensin-2 complex subunit H2 isoform X2 n=1 Tax=Oxyura jamaicensis TaxID=8884 RepID=UPI0015A5E6B5|nr:condensin-2 complex subunit H2 isoform X2 [Oxyura jamaicensis]